MYSFFKILQPFYQGLTETAMFMHMVIELLIFI